MPADRFRGPRQFRLLFMTTMAVLSFTLGWLGWRVLRQDEQLEAKSRGNAGGNRSWSFSPLSMDVSSDGARIVLGHRPALHGELWMRDDLFALVPPRQ